MQKTIWRAGSRGCCLLLLSSCQLLERGATGEPTSVSTGSASGAGAEGGASPQSVGAGMSGSGATGGMGGGPTYLVAPSVVCTKAGSPCTNVTPLGGLHASYRKDYFLPIADYDEPNPDPTHGGRFQIAGVATVTGDVTDVLLDGQKMSSLLAEPKLEWYHVWPRHLEVGQPVWVSFHSQNPSWDNATSAHLTIQTTLGTALDGDFSVAQTPVPLTYVTTTDDYGSLLIHVQNRDTVPHTLTELYVNGRPVLANGACVADPTVAPGESAMWTVPLCAPAIPGDPWTVVATYADGPDSVGVGRVLRAHYPIEAWPVGSECSFPGGDSTHFDRHRAAGFDTYYMHFGTNPSCSYQPSEVINTLGPALGDFHVLIGDDFLGSPNPGSAITNTSAVAGFLTGDESDGHVYATGVPQPEAKAALARELWSLYPDIAVYNGAKTNRNVGSFAGSSDVQGMDFYIAACAPHITAFNKNLPLRGAYDYLRNARNNHMPLPTWTYAQGLHEGWNRSIGPFLIHVQPDPQEILLQAFSSVAAGGKGLMWFQTSLAEADHAPARWQAIRDANVMIDAVREQLRAGDITGEVTASPDTLVDVVRGPRALIVPILNMAHDAAPTDLSCLSFTSEQGVPHWVSKSQLATVSIPVPKDFGVVDIFEVGAHAVGDSSFPVAFAGRTVNLSSIPLDNSTPVRLIVLAADASLRAEMSAIVAAHAP